jgi:hypothetical protein
VTFASVSRNLADSGINVTLSNVYTVMNTSFTRTPPTEWAATIRLGIWVSLAAALVAVTVGQIAEPFVVISTIIAGSWLSWRQIDLNSRRPAPRRVHVSRH